MYIPDELKLNKFKAVSMPSARDFFKLTGFQSPNPNGYTGDEPAPMPANKVDSIVDFQDYADMKAREFENSKSNANKGD